MARVKAASFEDRLTLVEHLDELRKRLIFSAVALVVVAALVMRSSSSGRSLADAPAQTRRSVAASDPRTGGGPATEASARVRRLAADQPARADAGDAGQLEQAALRLEAGHPRLAALLGQIADTLAKIGI